MLFLSCVDTIRKSYRIMSYVCISYHAEKQIMNIKNLSTKIKLEKGEVG